MKETTMISGFQTLMLDSRMMRAIDEMGYEQPTEIQSQSIPLIRQGADIIGRSQTGTGKTMAFAIPAIEKIDTDLSAVQVLIMCPTRELALQCSEEIKKLTKYIHGIRPVTVYGGAPMDRQITALKRANIVIGTPGRIMDHLRRRTLHLQEVKLAVLDEADEMLSMGFKEDMETILRETPEQRQTALFSATMPPSIIAITEEFQHDPQMVQVSRKQVTLDNIIQSYVDVPMGRKADALKLLLYYYAPSLSIVFVNTKKMADELTESLQKSGFNADALHGDLKQSQRNAVMDKFRSGTTSILVATDVAARGIDVNDVAYVFNYDIPQNNEYYVHRIGRTGRIGKQGNTVTICSGRRQVLELMGIVRELKCKAQEIPVPTGDDIRSRMNESNAATVTDALERHQGERYADMVNLLLEKGYSLFDIASAALYLNFSQQEIRIADIKQERRRYGKNGDMDFSKIVIDIGRSAHAAPNHLVASITERSLLHGADIGKIEIYDDYSVISVPSESIEDVVDQMYGAKVCGRPVRTRILDDAGISSSYPDKRSKPHGNHSRYQNAPGGRNGRNEKSVRNRRSDPSASHGKNASRQNTHRSRQASVRSKTFSHKKG